MEYAVMPEMTIDTYNLFYRISEGRNTLTVGVDRNGEEFMSEDFCETIKEDLRDEIALADTSREPLDQEDIEDWYSIASRLAETAGYIRSAILMHEQESMLGRVA